MHTSYFAYIVNFEDRANDKVFQTNSLEQAYAMARDLAQDFPCVSVLSQKPTERVRCHHTYHRGTITDGINVDPVTTGKYYFLYDDLDEDGKQTARDWYATDYPEYKWWDYTYDMIETVADIIGLSTKPASFCFELDRGAYFHLDGSYQYTRRWEQKFREEFGNNPQGVIGAFYNDYKAFVLQWQKPNFYNITATVDSWRTTTGNYNGHISPVYDAIDSAVYDMITDFRNMALRLLQQEYDYIISDDYIAETMRMNEYTFDECGNKL